MNKYLWLMLCFLTVLAVGPRTIACTYDEEDDIHYVYEDDDDDVLEGCEKAWTFFDDCGWALSYDNGGDIDLEDLITWCEEGEAFFGDVGFDCLANNYDDCEASGECIGNVMPDSFGNEDDIDDDDDDSDAPILSAGGWDPAVTILGEFPGYDERMYHSTLFWSVYDPNNDLMPDGQVFILYHNSTDPFLQYDLFWADLNEPPDCDLENVDDIENPVGIELIILFASESEPNAAPPGDYCVDIKATDNAGNLSKPLTNLCVTHNPN